MDQKEGTKRCELKSAQKLIEQIPALDNKTVTADSLHCQKATARQIVEKGGEYLLQIKENQPNLLELAKRQVNASPLFANPAAVTEESKNDS